MPTSPTRRVPMGIRRDLQAVGQLKGDSMESESKARTGQSDETDRLISSEKVDGSAVYNRNGDRLGTVGHLMIDKFTGQVEYAVMSFGGFLGIGESYNPVPWKSLRYDVNLGGYVMDTDRARLASAPGSQSSGHPHLSGRAYARPG